MPGNDVPRTTFKQQQIQTFGGAVPTVINDVGDWFFIAAGSAATGSQQNLYIARDGESAFLYGPRNVVKGSFSQLNIASVQDGTFLIVYGEGDPPDLSSPQESTLDFYGQGQANLAAGASAGIQQLNFPMQEVWINVITAGADVRLCGVNSFANQGVQIPPNQIVKFKLQGQGYNTAPIVRNNGATAAVVTWSVRGLNG